MFVLLFFYGSEIISCINAKISQDVVANQLLKSSLIFAINATQKCETSNADNNTCVLPDEFKADYSLYVIKIIPGHFGAANIIFSKENKQVKHLVVITEPRRIIDLIFDVYIWVFQVVVSILMGCLLDWEILLNILKIPYPVLIGLCSQFILMPLLAFSISFISFITS